MKLNTIFSIALVLAVAGFIAFSMQKRDTQTPTDYTTQINTQQDMNTNTNPEMNISASGLGIQIIRPGSGPAAMVGDTVVVNYTGTLEDGTKFDSSLNPGREPFSFTLGEHSVIDGWEQGILGMQKGEQRRLNIPGDLAYGAQGRPPVIPPNATLIFDVELLDIQ
jgi:FKBP-type peptidyl-prolyl cis-trans isomerase